MERVGHRAAASVKCRHLHLKRGCSPRKHTQWGIYSRGAQPAKKLSRARWGHKKRCSMVKWRVLCSWHVGIALQCTRPDFMQGLQAWFLQYPAIKFLLIFKIKILLFLHFCYFVFTSTFININRNYIRYWVSKAISLLLCTNLFLPPHRYNNSA